MSAATREPARLPPAWGPIGVLLAAVALAYANSWTAPFVYDDTLAIVENPTIRRLWPLGDVLLPQTSGGLTVSGRPILNLSFALNHAVSGTAPWSYHVFNTLVHAGAALLLFGLVRRTLHRGRRLGTQDGDRVALAAAALWALHPLQTQAVTYTVQRAESLMGLFYLLTLYAFVRAIECHGTEDTVGRSRRRRWTVVCVAACALGMATKEVMATAPLLVLLYDRTFGAGTFAGAWRARRGLHLALAATWLLLAALIASTGGNRGGTVGLGVGLPLWAYPLTQFQAVARYLGLGLWPHPLVFEYGTLWVGRASQVLPYALVVLPLLALTGVALWRRPALGFLGAWFFVILAPTSLAPGTIQMIVEHRMYLPLAAVAVAAVLTLRAVAGRPALVAAALLALGGGVLTARRNADYRSHLALWSDTVAKRPLNPRAHEGLAEAWAALGRTDEALRHRQEALRLLPDESTYHYNLALTLADAGRPADAVRHYRLALRLVPTEPRTHNNLAIALTKLGDHAGALAHHAEAVRLEPANPLYHYNYGVALARAGRPEAAIAAYRATLRRQPGHADAHFNLGTALARAQQPEAAIASYREALRLKPADPDYRTALGGALLLARRPEEARAEFQAVVDTGADTPEARFGLGNALAALRRPAEALRHYEHVLARNPRHANARFKLGNALLDLDRVPEAIAQFTAALQEAPADAEAHHNLGVAYARLERWAEAERAFEAALRLRPDYADAQRNLAQLRALLGR